MPDVLGNIPTGEDLIFSPNVLRRSPFAGDVAYVIALWAHTDGDIASILSRMLKSDIEVGTAMYLALVGSGSQKSALKAVAKVALPEWQFILLQAVLNVTEPLREERNRFAHWVWGYCAKVSNGLLLTPPRTIVEHNASFRQRVLELPDGRGVIRPMPIDNTKVLVYRELDFQAAVQAAERASNLYRLLYGSIADPTASGPREQLIDDERVLTKVISLVSSAGEEARSLLFPN